MKRSQAIAILRRHINELKKYGVSKLSLFGSTVRDDARRDSDVDLLVEFNRTVGLFEFFSLQHRLEEILGVDKVDLVQTGALHPELKDDILAEAQHVA